MKRNLICLILLLLSLFIATNGFTQQKVIQLGLNSQEPNGTFNVSLLQDDVWIDLGRLPFQMNYTAQELEVPEALGDAESLSVRIMKQGGGASHIDSISIPGFSLTSGHSELYKLRQTDHDVVDSSAPLILQFTKHSDSFLYGKIEIIARIEAETIGTTPFRFPVVNTFRKPGNMIRYFPYRTGSNPGALSPNGDLTEEFLQDPFFEGYYPVGSGHPQGSTFGWVMDDGETLYVAVDFTPDNTIDGIKDYAAVQIQTPAGIKRYKISEEHTEWGMFGFTYTDRVTYQHKVYEFAIPFDELGIQGSPQDIGLVFETYGTGMPAGNYWPDVAYNSIRNEYLLVYQDVVNPDVYVKAQLLGSDGTPLGAGEFDVGLGQVADNWEAYVSVAYDPLYDRYLTVWNDDSDLVGGEAILGRFVNADGTINPTDVLISDDLETRYKTDVAYNSVSGQFCVVWTEAVAPDNIMGRIINGDGSFATNVFAVANQADGQFDPAIAFDSVNQRYMVVFVDFEGGYDIISGQILNADGTPYGGIATNVNFPVLKKDLVDHVEPDIIFDAVNAQYVVTAFEAANATVQIFDTDGNLFDHDGDMVTVGEENQDFQVLDAGSAYPTIAYNPVSNSYLAAWEAFNVDEDIEGLYLQPSDVVPMGVPQLSADSPSTWQSEPLLIANPFCDNFLLVFEIDTGSLDLAVTTIGACSPDPGLAWTDGQYDGVTPDNGVSGDLFTFDIEYISASNTAPVTAELWIDLNGDGAYANLLPPVPGRFTGGPLFYTMLGVALLSLILLLLRGF